MAWNRHDARARREEDDRYTLLQREAFRTAADYVTAALSGVPAVRKIALFGSLASLPTIETERRWRGQIHRPKDVDLAVWLDGPADLNQLRILCSHAVHRLSLERGLGVAHHQVDVFFLDTSDRYLGRLCRFNQCPKHKPECMVDGCGKLPFLRQHEDFVFDATKSLTAALIQVLYERS